MSWQLDPDLEQLVITAVSGRREVMAREISQKGIALAEALSARGLGRSGAAIVGSAKISDDAYETFAFGIIEDVFGLFRSIYGEIPVEAAPWLKEKLLESIG